MKRRLLIVAWIAGWALSAAASPATNENAAPRELSVQKCVELALEHNPDLRTASEQFLSVEGKAIRLHAILYPTVNAQVLSTPLTFYVQINETFYSRATLPQLRLSLLSEQQAFINYRQTLCDVIFQVRQAFTNALGAREQIRLARQFADRETASMKTSQQFFDAGHAQRSEVSAIQVKANLAAQNMTLADLSFTQARLALSNLLGVEISPSIVLLGDLNADRAPTDLNAGLLSAQALRNRSDLKLLESLQLSATQQIQIDLKNAYPTVGFSSNSAFQPPTIGTGGFDLERNYNDPGTQRSPGNSQIPLTLYFNWLIFDGGNLAGGRAASQANIASREVALVQLRQSISGEVSAAVATILAERDTLQALGQETSPDDLRRSAQTDFEASRVRQLDKVNLEDDILAQEQLRLGARVRLSLAAAALDHALGRGLDAPLSPSVH